MPAVTAPPSAGAMLNCGEVGVRRVKGAAPTAASVPEGISASRDSGRRILRTTRGVMRSTISVLAISSF
jgi:hypothetical protein